MSAAKEVVPEKLKADHNEEDGSVRGTPQRAGSPCGIFHTLLLHRSGPSYKAAQTIGTRSYPASCTTCLGAFFFGTCVKVHRFLKMIGLLPGVSGAKGNECGGSIGPDSASEINKLLQTGM